MGGSTMGGSTIVLAGQQISVHHDLKVITKNKCIQNESLQSEFKQNEMMPDHMSQLSEDQQEPTITPYDQVRPKNEWSFMNHIRAWEKRQGFKTPIIWSSVIAIFVFHIISVAWVLINLACLSLPMWQTAVFGVMVGGLAGFGVTGGAHRYWCHRSFKARLPLQIILLVCYSIAGQNNIFNWVRDHRVHHKFSESAADPHDAHRGFFFSHVGWLMMRKHPEVIRRGNQVDMSDIARDPLLRFHTKYFNVFKAVFCFVLPVLTPALCWGESWWFSVGSQALFRYTLSLNFTWSVNSFAHMFGNKPYDRNIMPVENWSVSAVAMGEGWHNYHHTFPWDYKAAELAYTMNITTHWLDLFRRVGWAYDARVASPQLIGAVARNKGDRSKLHSN